MKRQSTAVCWKGLSVRWRGERMTQIEVEKRGAGDYDQLRERVKINQTAEESKESRDVQFGTMAL